MISIEPLDEDLLHDIAEYRLEAAERLGIDPAAEPAAIVERINDYVRQAKREGRTLDDDTVVGLGALLGEQYVRRFGWRWRRVIRESDGENPFVWVLAPDDSFGNVPIWWVGRVAAGGPTNFLLNFNCVAAGKHPREAAGAAAAYH